LLVSGRLEATGKRQGLMALPVIPSSGFLGKLLIHDNRVA
jgi:hypothetical protein